MRAPRYAEESRRAPTDSIFFITRDGVLHGLDSNGKETMRREADGSSPAVLPDGTVIAMASSTSLAAIGPAGGSPVES